MFHKLNVWNVYFTTNFLIYQAIGSETTGLFVQLPQNDTIPQGVSRHKTLFQMAV